MTGKDKACGLVRRAFWRLVDIVEGRTVSGICDSLLLNNNRACNNRGLIGLDHAIRPGNYV